MGDSMVRRLVVASTMKGELSVNQSESIESEISELERLAKVGKAFEDAKNKEFGIFEYVPYAGAKTDMYPITEYEYNKVLEWSEGER